MKNRDYWKKRFELLEENRYRSGRELASKLEQTWNRAASDIQKDVERWLYRIAENNGISYAAAKKLLDVDQLNEFHWDVQTYIKKGEENALNERWVKELENASARVHISRLEAMKLQLQQHLEVLYAEYNSEVDDYLRTAYRDDYYHTAFEVAKGTGIGVDLHKISVKELDVLLKAPWAADGKVFSSRIWNNKEKLVQILDQELTQQIIRGSDPQKTINSLSQKLNTTKRQAGTLVMTESAAISSAARKNVFEDLDVEKYEIVATLDLRTSEICRDMDGKVFKMSEYQEGNTAPPFHPNCRSTTAPWFPDFQDKGERAYRDIETGKTDYVPEDMTYHEWYAKYVEGSPRAKMEEKKIQNEASDKKQYEKYQKILGSEMPESFEKFQSLKYNEPEQWKKLRKKKAVYSEIAEKEWTDEFKKKTKQAYKNFEKEGITLSSHALSRLPRVNKKGFPEIEEKDLLSLLKSKPRYRDSADRVAYFSEELQLAAVQNQKTNDIVTIVRAKRPKGDWKNV